MSSNFDKAHIEVRDSFIWTDDRVVHGDIDHWDDLSDKMIADSNYIIRDDCDTCSITKAGIAHKRYGINPKDLELWGVLTEVGQQFNKDFGAVIKLMDHMVLVYKGMVADNRQSFIYNQGWAGYDWVARSTYHDLSVWEGI